MCHFKAKHSSGNDLQPCDKSLCTDSGTISKTPNSEKKREKRKINHVQFFNKNRFDHHYDMENLTIENKFSPQKFRNTKSSNKIDSKIIRS